MLDAYDTIVIGSSAGGFAALAEVLPCLPVGLPQAVVVVQHLYPGSGGYLIDFLGRRCALPVKEAEEKESLLPGTIYVAPSGYHLLIERERTFSLSVDAKVHFARPSIDVLFESAAESYGARLIGVVLTGANADGSAGLAAIKARGGLAIVQDPASAEVSYMPQAALEATKVDYILDLAAIGRLLGGTE